MDINDIIHVLRRIIILVLVVYIGITVILYLLQDRMIFHRPGISEERLRYIREAVPDAEEVTVDTPDNVRLHGWLVHSQMDGPSPLLIYFGGNAEEVSWMIEARDRLPRWSILLVNYRGYGLSEGSPGEDELLRDALLIYDIFSEREEINGGEIAVMGRSLGSAPATYVSGMRTPAATVLVSSFGSIQEVAENNFPLIPVSRLLRHKFDIKSYAENAGNPMLTIVASNDRIIPAHHSGKLFQAWDGEKEFVVIQNAGHNDISLKSLYWESLKNFLDGHLREDHYMVTTPFQ